MAGLRFPPSSPSPRPILAGDRRGRGKEEEERKRRQEIKKGRHEENKVKDVTVIEFPHHQAPAAFSQVRGEKEEERKRRQEFMEGRESISKASRRQSERGDRD